MTSPIRCAIYTRKSTEEGLEQAFNSLDAQREAGEAYIASQKHEGWTCLPAKYDDGGFSGGSMERPALKRLLEDIEAGGIDCVVVYKVDRLSRSLLDFARIMELFDGHGVSFVSVTQQFNTTSSMGRLTLNILLSFAQFEREIISERTRDKVVAARRKGKWIGGFPILGYDVAPEGGRLVVNQDEAEQVRQIFFLYLKLRTISAVVAELHRRGWRGKSWTTKKGRWREGRDFTKPGLSKLLTNVAYIGKVAFRDQVYEGEHEAIIDERTFAGVQELLASNRQNGGALHRNRHGALLKELVYCSRCGARMAHTYTNKHGKLYQYYVCSTRLNGTKDQCDAPRIPVGELDRFVTEQIKGIGKHPDVVEGALALISEQQREKVPALESERNQMAGELRRLKNESRKLVSALANQDAGNGRSITERLAEVDARGAAVERRLEEIRTELEQIHSRQVDAEDLRTALSIFDPVWDVLYPKERARVFQLLIERVDFDGAGGKLDISFSPLGIKLLAHEVRGGKEIEWTKQSG